MRNVLKNKMKRGFSLVVATLFFSQTALANQFDFLNSPVWSLLNTRRVDYVTLDPLVLLERRQERIQRVLLALNTLKQAQAPGARFIAASTGPVQLDSGGGGGGGGSLWTTNPKKTVQTNTGKVTKPATGSYKPADNDRIHFGTTTVQKPLAPAKPSTASSQPPKKQDQVSSAAANKPLTQTTTYVPNKNSAPLQPTSTVPAVPATPATFRPQVVSATTATASEPTYSYNGNGYSGNGSAIATNPAATNSYNLAPADDPSTGANSYGQQKLDPGPYEENGSYAADGSQHQFGGGYNPDRYAHCQGQGSLKVCPLIDGQGTGDGSETSRLSASAVSQKETQTQLCQIDCSSDPDFQGCMNKCNASSSSLADPEGKTYGSEDSIADYKDGQGNKKSVDGTGVEYETAVGSLADIPQCQEKYSWAVQVCGSATERPSAQLVKTLVDPQLYQNYLTQSAAMKASVNDMKGQCQNVNKMSQTLAALNASYAGACEVARTQCVSSCSNAEPMLMSNMQRVQRNGGESGSVLAAISRARSTAKGYTESCQNSMGQYAAESFISATQNAQMAQRSQMCVQALSSIAPCSTAEDMGKPECQNYCSQPQNRSQPMCIAQASDCSNPSVASSNPRCICIANPSHQLCKIAGMPGSGGGSRLGVPGGSSNSSLGRAVASNGNGPSGFFGGGSGDGSMSFSSLNGGAGGNAAGGLASSYGSQGGGGGAGGAGPSAYNPGKGGNGRAGAGYDTDIRGGILDAPGGARRVGGFNAHGSSGSSNWNLATRGGKGLRQNQMIDINKFRPKSYGQLAALDLSSRDGITGPHGPTLFEKVSRRYRAKEPQLSQK